MNNENTILITSEACSVLIDDIKRVKNADNLGFGQAIDLLLSYLLNRFPVDEMPKKLYGNNPTPFLVSDAVMQGLRAYGGDESSPSDAACSLLDEFFYLPTTERLNIISFIEEKTNPDKAID